MTCPIGTPPKAASTGRGAVSSAAQAIEAGTDETHSGSVHESAVRQDAPSQPIDFTHTRTEDQ